MKKMAANDLSFEQISAILNEIVNAATGQTFTAPINTKDFVTQAQVGLKTGYDPLSTAINQVMSRTIFSERSYSGHFKSMMVDALRFGNIVRKLNISDAEWENDNKFSLTDGESIDDFVVKKPKVLQTNFYGSNVYSDHVTIYKDQLDCAFSSPDELARFFSMVLNNINDRAVQARENLNRSCLTNLMGSCYQGGRVIHLVTAFNNISGSSLTPTSINAPENYKSFMQWLASYVATISGLMTERSMEYHTNVTGYKVMRHTPYEMQKMYINAGTKFSMDSRVLADAYHDNYVKLAANESVNFWQDIQNPTDVTVDASYLKADGTVGNTGTIELNNVLGVIFDEEAAGTTEINQWSMPTRMNASGGYTNHWYHFTDRYWEDDTENACLLLLD